jgi:threonylcarbamoyladenosine tRNA methylthiotransferase MtaB
MRHVQIRTFGCKLNQYDSQLISESFARSGYRIVREAERADVCVVNTCSVTARSDYEARHSIRRIVRSGRGQVVVVTGCYSQRAPDELRAVEGVDLVAGNVEKASLPRLVDELVRSGRSRAEAVTAVSPLGAGACVAGCDPLFQRRARALLKIQDGCDACCSYCVVPQARGRSRSVPSSVLVEEANLLGATGYSELVLTGARIGSYGRDLGNGSCLEGLVGSILSGGAGYRIRLSSLDPFEITDSFLKHLAGENRLCAHFHVPLQSGADATLKRMGRPYSGSEYLDRVAAIRRTFPGACIGSDVIVGFPGEEEEDFRRTYELVESAPLCYVHVFPYSRRPGTAAFSMPGQVPRAVKKARGRALLELARRKRHEFALSQKDTVQVVIVEEELEPGLFTGTTGNYLRVHMRANGIRPRDSIRVRVGDCENGRLVAQLC